MSKPTVYIETSIFSYLTSRPSRDLHANARQERTHRWWDTQRDQFALFVSDLVVAEASRGDVDAARRRLDALASIPRLGLAEEARPVTTEILAGTDLPTKAAADAAHIALAAVNGIDYLLTWNCRHIANPFIQRSVRRVVVALGFEPPIIATPEEFVGRYENE